MSGKDFMNLLVSRKLALSQQLTERWISEEIVENQLIGKFFLEWL
jgi:hypothetical protein